MSDPPGHTHVEIVAPSKDSGASMLEWISEGCSNVRMAADSTMFRMVNRLMALSLGVHREQLEQRMGLTCPRPFLLRPLHHTGRISIVPRP